MVTSGVASTLAPVVALKPVAGDHVYADAPAAVSVVVTPAQTVVVRGATVTFGYAFTVTVTDAVPLQPADVPVTV